MLADILKGTDDVYLKVFDLGRLKTRNLSDFFKSDAPQNQCPLGVVHTVLRHIVQVIEHICNDFRHMEIPFRRGYVYDRK